MKRVLLAVAVAVSAAAVGRAQESGESAEVPPKAEAPKVAKAAFTTLPLCRLVEGHAEVRLVGGDWATAEEGRFYPLGTSYRTVKNGRLVLSFGEESAVSIEGDAEFATKGQGLREVSRTVLLVRGTVNVRLPENLPEDAFFVSAPGFTAKNPAGESRYAYEDKGDGDVATVRCVTGSLGIEGRHFDVPMMHSANEIVIRTSHDHLLTFLYGTSGDYVVRLDQGLRLRDEIGNDGKMTRSEEKASVDWHLTPATKVIISRAVPALGARMSVHTMAFDAAGERKSECYFCEGRPEVNSGELVVKDKIDGEELAKRAAEAAETTSAEAEAAEPAEESSNNNEG